MRTTPAAAEWLDANEADRILSDIRRRSNARAGSVGLKPLRELADGAPLIFDVSELDPDAPTPGGAFRITNDSQELLHLVFDALERGVG